MTARASTIITTAVALAIGAASTLGLYYLGIAVAHADDGSGSAATAAAPVAAGSGSAATPATPAETTPAVTPEPPVAATAATIHDPAAQPAAAWSDLKAARKVGWPVAIFAGLLLLTRTIGRFSKSSLGTFLAKGRIAVAIAGGGAVAASCYDVAMQGGSWTAIAMAGIVGISTFMHPHAAPAKP